MSAETNTGESLASALGRIPSGLFVLTACHGRRVTGMLVSWVQQCSFDPPQLTVAIKKEREVLTWLDPDAAFVLNILPEGAKKLVGHFGKSFVPGDSAFDGVPVTRELTAAPVLDAAHAYLECRVVDRLDAGDHLLLVARVRSGAVLNEGHPTVHVRKNGLKY